MLLSSWDDIQNKWIFLSVFMTHPAMPHPRVLGLMFFSNVANLSLRFC